MLSILTLTTRETIAMKPLVHDDETVVFATGQREPLFNPERARVAFSYPKSSNGVSKSHEHSTAQIPH